MRSLLAAAVLFVAAAAARAGAPPPGKENLPLRPYKLPLDWKHFYSYEETGETLRKLQRAFPDLARIESIGKSRQGRDLWLIEIGPGDEKARSRRPAMYVDGNIHGNEIQGTEICLYLAWSLLNRSGSDRYPAPRHPHLLHRPVGQRGRPRRLLPESADASLPAPELPPAR
jgi:hypothetical protein